MDRLNDPRTTPKGVHPPETFMEGSLGAKDMVLFNRCGAM